MRKEVFGFALSAMLFALCFPAEAQQRKKSPGSGIYRHTTQLRESTRSEAVRLACVSLAT